VHSNKKRRKKRAGYATNSLLVPFGSDFQFTQAAINYDKSVHKESVVACSGS
jgi:hypothetical protein